MDEPFSGLDTSLRDELAQEVRALIQQAAIPAIHVTHDRVEARAMAERAIVLERGRVAHAGITSEVL
jgi:ABC-type sugar transport system ATPase subunit